MSIRTGRFGPLLLVVSLGLVAAACSGSDDAGVTTTAAPSSTTSQPTTTSTTTEPPTTTTIPPDVDSGLGAVSATYAHVVFTIDGGTWSNATPGSFLDDAPAYGPDRILYLPLVAAFEPGYPGRTEEFAATDFSLVVADGTVRGVAVDFRSNLLVQAAGIDHALAFPSVEFDLAGATVVYDDGTHEPLVLPLDGSGSDPYPITTNLDVTEPVSWDGGCAETLGEVRVVDVEWDVDAGVDVDGDAIHSAGSARSLVGERWARVRVEATAFAGNCGGSVVLSDMFLMSADGVAIESENSEAIDLADGATVEWVLGYRVPLDSAELTVDVGLVGGTVARIPIVAPELP